MTSWGRPPEIRGTQLVLRLLRPDDADDLLTALGPPETAAEVLEHLAASPLPMTAEAARRVVNASLTDPDRWPFAQRLTTTGQLVGTTSFYEINPAYRSLAIGHTWLARPYWRTGINTESKLLLLRYAFEDLGAERVVWHTDIRNTRSQAAVLRLGAHREGVLRHHRLRRDGSWRDTVQFSMLAEEWPAVRDRLTARSSSGDDGGMPETLDLSHAVDRSRYEGR